VQSTAYTTQLIDYIETQNNQLTTLVIGSNISGASLLNQSYSGPTISVKSKKEKLLETASLYLYAPYLWGGKTPMGIDCSGLTQMIYRINGYQIPRDASQQAELGNTLSFIDESEPGDLAFFDNDEGKIIHVGLLLENNYILHAHGKVRIDRIDQTGIYNLDTQQHSHTLRIIKKII
jgi:gamma-D-glutamyl-L-lysine dipeptidyl-peptidase